MTTARKQFDLFEGVIPPDTPLGNFQCQVSPNPSDDDDGASGQDRKGYTDTQDRKSYQMSSPVSPPSPLPPPPANPYDHHKRFCVTADEHVAALEWLSDNDQTFADLEDRQCELEEIGDTVGAAVVQEQLDRIVADYLESVRRFEPKTPLLDATKATEALESAPPAKPPPLKWNQLAQGRKAMVGELEKHLREKGWPYVAVDEAKKAIFNSSQIDAFDFLVYSTVGPNLLVLVVTRRPTPAQVQQMTEWEKVFGKDFVAAFTFHTAGQWRTLSLKDLANPDPLAVAGSLDEHLNQPL